MTDLPKTLEQFRLPLSRDTLKQARDAAAPMFKHARDFALPAFDHARDAAMPMLKRMRVAGVPAIRRAPRSPLLLIGAAVLGVAGYLAWRNREKIAAAAPAIEGAKVKGQALVHDAAAKGHELIDQAKAKGDAMVDKVARVRRGAADPAAGPDLH
ncbi:hypothetical protein [Phenylobacterium sp.]|uniref:hypothetical protein n=1 Tax=Phenylobacterium sp. TaxID=1871053 RepID=UPI0025D39BB0|nr:hypothetical protein [Phenylobacterium sp.]